MKAMAVGTEFKQAISNIFKMYFNYLLTFPKWPYWPWQLCTSQLLKHASVSLRMISKCSYGLYCLIHLRCLLFTLDSGIEVDRNGISENGHSIVWRWKYTTVQVFFSDLQRHAIKASITSRKKSMYWHVRCTLTWDCWQIMVWIVGTRALQCTTETPRGVLDK